MCIFPLLIKMIVNDEISAGVHTINVKICLFNT